MNPSIFTHFKAVYCIVLCLVLLGCSSANGQKEYEELAVLTYLEVISQDVLGVSDLGNVRFCLAEETETKVVADPRRRVIARVGANAGRVAAISDCDVKWLMHESTQTNGEWLDVMLWIRKVAMGGEKATVTIVGSDRYGKRIQFVCEFVIDRDEWSVASLKMGVIE